MATRAEFLDQVWSEIINAPMSDRWVDAVVSNSERKPGEPFADVGPVLRRLLAAGASRRDLGLLARYASYEAAFQLLYMLDDPGVDGDDIKMLHEQLLSADPSGQDGRPGSAP